MLGLGMIVAFVAAIVAGMNLVGPFIVWVVALGLARTAPTPSLMVGARRLAGDPRAGWRAVSGITFALVIAGFLTVISLITRSTGPEDAMLATAMSTGGVLTLGIAAVLAAVSTGVTQTARVIDQAPVLRAQHIAGAEAAELRCWCHRRGSAAPRARRSPRGSAWKACAPRMRVCSPPCWSPRRWCDGWPCAPPERRCAPPAGGRSLPGPAACGPSPVGSRAGLRAPRTRPLGWRHGSRDRRSDRHPRGRAPHRRARAERM